MEADYDLIIIVLEWLREKWLGQTQRSSVRNNDEEKLID